MNLKNKCFIRIIELRTAGYYLQSDSTYVGFGRLSGDFIARMSMEPEAARSGLAADI